MSALPYLNGYWGFRLGPCSGFCRLNTTGRWSLPCDARISACVHGASLGDISVSWTVLSVSPVSPCREPRCVGVAVDTGVKRRSLSASSSALPCWLLSGRPSIQITTHHGCVSQFVFHVLKDVPTCSCGAGGRVHE